MRGHQSPAGVTTSTGRRLTDALHRVVRMFPYHPKQLVGEDVDDPEDAVAGARDDGVLVKLPKEGGKALAIH